MHLLTKQATGGNGASGGSGGRIAIYYNMSFFNGEFTARGGNGRLAEAGAAGTVFIKDMREGSRTLMIYNQRGAGVSMFSLIML